MTYMKHMLYDKYLNLPLCNVMGIHKVMKPSSKAEAYGNIFRSRAALSLIQDPGPINVHIYHLYI